ncbi:MAG: RdgB/HAM1 family non-canonical purine NTP pyrophosphatase [Planctomycetota bacterium]|jgi:XTP/dITP diphosphohydrolase
MKRKILVASTNPGKLAELRAMLDADVEWVSLSDLEALEEVVEDGVTFGENAHKKALGYAKMTGLWTIADDSGLEVDMLDGAPGVKSARFSGKKSKDRGLLDHKNMAKVLELLQGIKGKDRRCRFVCRLALANPDKILLETEGVLEGFIAEHQQGENGFGYDPIFFLPRLNKTVAQLTAKQKNAISHRGNAIRRLKPLLEKLLEETSG